jgi:hypothetical protein
VTTTEVEELPSTIKDRTSDRMEASPRSDRPSAVAHVLCWAALSAAFTLLVLNYSLTRGKLIVPAKYDDVTYLRDGLAKLDSFYRGGLNGLLGSAIDHPPHSPFSTIVAFTGYAFFGVHDWSPYAANAVIIFGLLAFVDFLTRGLPPWQKLLCFLFTLTVPIAAQSVYEFRSDMAVGLLTAVFIVLIIQRPFVRAPARYPVVAGVLLGITLLCKTSVFPITLGLAGSAMLAATVRDRILLGRAASIGAMAKAWAFVLLPGLLIPLPFYFHNRHEIFYYVTVNALGSNSHIWHLHADLKTHLLYYATGAGAAPMLGRHFGIMAIVLIAGGALALSSGQKTRIARAACYAFVFLVAYVGPTLNPIKDPFLGVTFDFLMIFVTLLVFRDLLAAGGSSFEGRAAQLALVLLFVAGAWYAKWPMYWGERTRADVVMRNRYMNDLYQGVRSNAPDGKAKVLVGVSGVFVNADALGYMADKDGLTHLDFRSEFTNGDLDGFRRQLDGSRFVITGDVGNPEDDPNTPYSEILDRTLAMVRSRPDFSLIAVCPTDAGKNYYLFEHAVASK